jgi:polyphosphate kinase
MTRNLDYRVEVAAPVFDPDIQKEIRQIFNAGFKDNVKARIVDGEQTNTFKRSDNQKDYQSQVELYKYYQKQSRSS